MAAFIILLISCAVLTSGYLLRHTGPDAIDKEDERYLTGDGHHIYYDRKLLRHLREEENKVQEKQTTKSTI